LQLTEITRKLTTGAGNATHFVVFDACRNTLHLTKPGSKAIVQSKGFVPVTQENGMLIAYATAEGGLASDVGAGAGPYAQALAEEVVKPGIEAVVMFRIVQRRVRAAIRQEPYLGFSALGDVYLAGPPPPTPAHIVDREQAEIELAIWNTARAGGTIAALQAYLERYPNGLHAGAAKTLIEQMRQEEALRAALEEREIELRKAEEAKRLADAKREREQKNAEEAKRADELARARKEVRKAQEAVRKAEAERAAALQAADQARRAAEAAKDSVAKSAAEPQSAPKPNQPAGGNKNCWTVSGRTFCP
jgi:hypothetical protein